jgi:hypothetical protein
MEAWMKQDSVDRKVVSERFLRKQPFQSAAKEALRITMAKYVSVVNRTKGHGLKHVKTHSVLHVPDDVLWFGSPNNWNSARVESGHKFHAKAPAKYTQLRKDRLEEQVSAQTTDLLALNMATDLIWKSKNYLITNDTNTPSQTAKLLNGGSQFVVKVANGGRRFEVEFMENAKSKTKTKSKSCLACEARFQNHDYDEQIHFLADLFIGAMKDSWEEDPSYFFVAPFEIPCFTEIKVVDDNGVSQIYRGHPAYRGEDPWHDWVNVKWRGLDRRMKTVPAEIIFFVDVNEQLFPYARSISGYRGEGTYAVIHSMKEEPKTFGSCQLLSRGIRETEGEGQLKKNVFHFQHVDSFVNPAFVVDNIGCRNDSLFVLLPRSEWAKEFL